MSDLTATGTLRWCEDRDHPWSTYNPWLDKTWCRCGKRTSVGEQSIDLDAVWEMFHDHGCDERCRCYSRPDDLTPKEAR